MDYIGEDENDDRAQLKLKPVSNNSTEPNLLTIKRVSNGILISINAVELKPKPSNCNSLPTKIAAETTNSSNIKRTTKQVINIQIQTAIKKLVTILIIL